MSSCIYLLTNTVNQKQYVGFTTKSLLERCEQHLALVKRGSQWLLHRAIRKYGWASFTSEIIYMSEDDDYCLKEAEVVLIADYNTKKPNGYNMTDGGEGTLGHKHSDETKAKMSKDRKGIGHKQTDETKAKISKANTNPSKEKRANYSKAAFNRPPCSDEAKANMSASQKGRKHTSETKAKISAAHQNRPPITDQTRAKMSASRKGSKWSRETRVKMEISIKNRTNGSPPPKHLFDMLRFFSQTKIGEYYGVSQVTISNWKIANQKS